MQTMNKPQLSFWRASGSPSPGCRGSRRDTAAMWCASACGNAATKSSR
jgi:hypothetical protein